VKRECLAVLACLTLLGPLTACSDAFSPAVCTTPVEISVTSGTSPSFSWTPTCQAAGLTVEAMDGSGTVMWTVVTLSTQNTLEAPVRYGQRPKNTSPTPAAQALMTGTRYRVSVIAAQTGSNGVSLFGIGSLEFIP
jgi:hypothetical protein